MKCRFYVGSLILAALSGCAFTDVPLDMPVRGLHREIPGGNNRPVYVAVPFTDKRDSPVRCGMQKNGYNMDTADAICKTPPNEWLAHVLADELRASGFDVLKTEPPAGSNVLKINGELLKFFVEPVIGFWSGSLEADISAKLIATTGTGLQAERTFFVKGVQKGVMFGTLTPFHNSVKRAADQIITEMVESIFYLMNKYPQISNRNDSPTVVAPTAAEGK